MLLLDQALRGSAPALNQAKVNVPGFHRLGVCLTQTLFKDAVCSLHQRLGLPLFALFRVEVRQAPKRMSYLGMIRSQCLLPEVQGTLIQRLGLPILALLRVEVCQALKRMGYCRVLWS